MDDNVTLSVVLGLISAALATLGFALQQRGNLAQITNHAGNETVSAAKKTAGVILNPWWIGGGVALIISFIVHAAAVSIGSLVIVEPLMVTSLVFMLPMSKLVGPVHLHRNEYLGAGLTLVGLMAFLFIAEPTGGIDHADNSDFIIGAIATAAAGLIALAVGIVVKEIQAPAFGASAGIFWALTYSTIKQATGAGDVGESAGWEWILAFVALALSYFMQNLSLRAGRLSLAVGFEQSFNPIAASFFGILVFQESIHTDPIHLVGALIGVVVALAGLAILVRTPALETIEEGDVLG